MKKLRVRNGRGYFGVNKVSVSFDIFDQNGDGIIESSDFKVIAKSAFLAALVIANQYNLTEEEYARYAKEVKIIFWKIPRKFLRIS